MSYDINRTILVGRLTRDPELRALSSGASVCSLRLACNGIRREAEGQTTERPNYFDVSVFGAPAEAVSTYMRRGSRVAVDGRLEWREWESAESERRQAVRIVADTVQFLDSPAGRSGEDDSMRQDGERDTDDARAGELVGVGVADEDDLGF